MAHQVVPENKYIRAAPVIALCDTGGKLYRPRQNASMTRFGATEEFDVQIPQLGDCDFILTSQERHTTIASTIKTASNINVCVTQQSKETCRLLRAKDEFRLGKTTYKVALRNPLIQKVETSEIIYKNCNSRVSFSDQVTERSVSTPSKVVLISPSYESISLTQVETGETIEYSSIMMGPVILGVNETARLTAEDGRFYLTPLGDTVVMFPVSFTPMDLSAGDGILVNGQFYQAVTAEYPKCSPIKEKWNSISLQLYLRADLDSNPDYI